MELEEFCIQFAVKQHKDELVEILKKSDVGTHYHIIVDGTTLFCASEHSSEALDVNDYLHWLYNKPSNFLQIFDRALRKAEQLICETHELKSSFILKPHIHSRISNMPPLPEIKRSAIPKIADYGRFLSISGTIIRTSQVKMLQFQKIYQCNKCKFKNKISAELELFYTMDSVVKCQNPITCDSAKFTPSAEFTDSYQCRDYQEIRIQEPVQKLELGNIPKAMSVILEDDLVDSCKPGDYATINGTVLRRWGKFARGTRPEIEIVMKANYVEVNNDQFKEGIVTEEINKEFEEFWRKNSSLRLTARNKILASFCPQVYGLYIVKLAFALVLSGGVPKVDECGTKVRGHSHLLLIGDPGTAKSQFLKYAAKLTPRSVMTTGIGSTSAGLTCAAVREEGTWHLQAGALVLADNGICCIDEFNSIREHDRGSIHEAMEQQSVSVAKAGLVCKLNTRCTLLAATNLKGRYDCTMSLSVNTAIASPLLSRFDIILVLLDSQNEDWDKLVSGYILQGNKPHTNTPSDNCESLWKMDKMRAYFSYIKSFNPKMTDDASLILKKYYQYQRRNDSENKGRTTVRLLESLVRLAQAHSRFTCQNEVTIVDAVVAVSVMEASVHGAAAILGASILHTAFPNDAESDYLEKAKVILEKLALQDLLEHELQLFGPRSPSSSPEKMTIFSENPLLEDTFNSQVSLFGSNPTACCTSPEEISPLRENQNGKCSPPCKRLRMESRLNHNVDLSTNVLEKLQDASKKATLKLSAFAFGNDPEISKNEVHMNDLLEPEEMIKYSQLAEEDLDFSLP